MSISRVKLAAIIAILVGGLALTLIAYVDLRRSSDATLFANLKQHCRVVGPGPYVNVAFGFRFAVRDGLLACEHQTDVPGWLEIYLWRRDAFESPIPLGFGKGIVGAIEVNQPSGIPARRLIATSSAVVAGTSVIVQKESPASCFVTCPVVRVAELVHGGAHVAVEEYDGIAGLLQSFAWEDVSKSR